MDFGERNMKLFHWRTFSHFDVHVQCLKYIISFLISLFQLKCGALWTVNIQIVRSLYMKSHHSFKNGNWLFIEIGFHFHDLFTWNRKTLIFHWLVASIALQPYNNSIKNIFIWHAQAPRTTRAFSSVSKGNFHTNIPTTTMPFNDGGDTKGQTVAAPVHTTVYKILFAMNYMMDV